jgi:hypothetical protein
MIQIHAYTGVTEIEDAATFSVDANRDVVLYDKVGLKVAIVAAGVWLAVVIVRPGEES